MATPKFIKSIDLQHTSGLVNTSLEVDDLVVSFSPVSEEFIYVDYSREYVVIGYLLDVNFKSRWLKGENALLPFYKRNDLQIRIPELNTGWLSVYLVESHSVDYNRQVKRNSQTLLFRGKTLLQTIPSWAEKITPQTIQKTPMT